MVLILVGLQQPVAVVHHSALVAREPKLRRVQSLVRPQCIGLGEHLRAVLALEAHGGCLPVLAPALEQTLLAVVRTHFRVVLKVIIPLIAVLENGHAY